MEGDSQKQPEPKNLTKERDLECVPLAREVLRILGAHSDLAMGSEDSGVTQEQAIEYYNNIFINELGPLFIEKNVKYSHIKYIFALVLEALEFLRLRTEMTLDNHYLNAMAYKWGVKDTRDIRISDIHETLLKAGEEKKAGAVDNPTGGASDK